MGRRTPEEGSDMQYLLLIYSEEPAEPTPQPEMDAIFKEWMEFDQAIRAAGVAQEGQAVQPSATATTLRLKSGERVVTDGPFAETREVLGGYYLLETPDLDTALDWAAKCPGAKYGAIELRPVMVFG